MRFTLGRLAFRVGVVTIAATLMTAGVVRSFEPTAAMKEGPATIDVSKYPDDQKAAYTVFTDRCSKCHKLNGKMLGLKVPINSNFVTPGEWERSVRRMLHKVDSKITEDQAKGIYRFLVYDSSVRKADSLQVHLAALSADERREAIEKIQAINPGFGPKGR